ncbi:hypothetical protein Tco_1477650 [Tanacetum coccineum]
MRQHKSFGNVIVDHLEDIMVSPLLQEKYLKPISTSHIYSVTHVGWSKFAMHVHEPTTSPQGTKHKYVVPTGRVVVPTGRYVVPAGKVIIIVSPGRLNLVPTGRILSPGKVK